MTRPVLPLAGILTLGSALLVAGASRSVAQAQGRNPLTNVKSAAPRRAPSWRNESWLNTPDGKPLTLDGLKGRVVLLNFWTFTCWNCTGAVPSLVDYDHKYRDQGL